MHTFNADTTSANPISIFLVTIKMICETNIKITTQGGVGVSYPAVIDTWCIAMIIPIVVKVDLVEGF